jgi:dCTP deaminase
VSNTSCLIALEAIGRLDLLERLYQILLIPSAVASEWASPCPSWVTIATVQNRALVQALGLQLGLGESEATALAVESGAARLILDDLRARRVAAQLQVRITGTLGILLRAKRLQVVSLVRPLFDDLRAAGFWVSDSLLRQARQLCGRITDLTWRSPSSRPAMPDSGCLHLASSSRPRNDRVPTIAHDFARRNTAMGVLPDWQIQRDITIEPFEEGRSRPGTISYGLTSYGYDVRVSRKFKVFTNVRCTVVDPKSFDSASFVDLDADFCLIPPNSFALAETVETLEIPRDILAICIGKSTYARCGIIVNITPLEPEWRGKITIEISNTTPLPAKIYAGEGIAQIVFFRADAVCKVSYADKKGKYQDQKGLTLPFVEG